MTDYRVEWDFTYARGEVGEQLAEALLKGEAAGTVEVKTDGKWCDTGNVYVEYQCQYGGTWRPSGIAVTQATHWAFVLEPTQRVIFIDTPTLKAIARDVLRTSGERTQPHGTHPTKGVAVPIMSLFQPQQNRRKQAS